MVTNYYKKIVFVVNTLLWQTIGRLEVPRCALYGMRYLIIGKTTRVCILSNSVFLYFGLELYFSELSCLIKILHNNKWNV